MSRFGFASLQAIEEEVSEIEPINTKNNRKYVWRQFMGFCEEKNYILDGRTPIDVLAKILTDWAFNMRKQNGDEYKEYTVKTIWNVTAKLLMEKYFTEFNIQFNPFTNIEFKAARDAKNAKRKQLQRDPQKRKESAVFLRYDEFQNMVRVCDENTPDGLQKKLFFVFAFELAWRGGEGHKCLISYFKEEENNVGEKTGRIIYDPVFTKTTQGGEKPCASSKWLVKNNINADMCPIRLYKKFLEKRVEIKTKRLFLTVNPAWKLNRKWYKDIPAGRNTVSKWTVVQAKASGLNTENIKITNHSLRATAVSNLAKNGVGEQQLIKITGHTNSKSITPYLQMDEDHHEEIVRRMRANDVQQAQLSQTSSSAVNAPIAALSNQNTYNNCVFNCSSCNF